MNASADNPIDATLPPTTTWARYPDARRDSASCAARAAGHYARSINGDAFSDEIKTQTIEAIRADLGQIDLVVYSLASPRRIHPQSGECFSSVLKPIGKAYTSKTVDVQTGEVSAVTIDEASEEEIAHTTAVMGGEDWEMWIRALDEAGVLAAKVRTVAYTYIGPEITRPVYRDGTIGQAKEHLEQTAQTLDKYLQSKEGSAHVSVNKAMVTQSCAAFPVVPLYISLLYKVMKEKECHESCIEQMYRLFNDRLYADAPTDAEGRIRVDDWEMREDVQAEVASLWDRVESGTLESLSDIESYRAEFLGLFGFGFAGIDYAAEVDPDRPL